MVKMVTLTLALVAYHLLDEHALPLEAELLRLQQVQLQLQLGRRQLQLHLAPLRQRQPRRRALAPPLCKTHFTQYLVPVIPHEGLTSDF